ncbi:hypothetical protein Bbelb_336820 [Branchiostoma belcheri]|nr:hypothetical protein Bbelb_336820 [Branchiostoma belcheri]
MTSRTRTICGVRDEVAELLAQLKIRAWCLGHAEQHTSDKADIRGLRRGVTYGIVVLSPYAVTNDSLLHAVVPICAVIPAIQIQMRIDKTGDIRSEGLISHVIPPGLRRPMNVLRGDQSTLTCGDGTPRIDGCLSQCYN